MFTKSVYTVPVNAGEHIFYGVTPIITRTVYTKSISAVYITQLKAYFPLPYSHCNRNTVYSFVVVGGIIEACPPSDSITSLSVDLLIDPCGNCKILSAADQVSFFPIHKFFLFIKMIYSAQFSPPWDHLCAGIFV